MGSDKILNVEMKMLRLDANLKVNTKEALVNKTRMCIKFMDHNLFLKKI